MPRDSIHQSIPVVPPVKIFRGRQFNLQYFKSLASLEVELETIRLGESVRKVDFPGPSVNGGAWKPMPSV